MAQVLGPGKIDCQSMSTNAPFPIPCPAFVPFICFSSSRWPSPGSLCLEPGKSGFHLWGMGWGVEPPKTKVGGLQEKGSIDRTSDQLL